VIVVDHCATPTQEGYSAVSESQRLALHRAARTALGEEEGDTLMELSTPANTDIATRQDVEHATQTLRAEMSLLEERRRADLASATNRTLVQTFLVVGTFQTAAVGFLTLTLR
jgi:hypothetical protein